MQGRRVIVFMVGVLLVLAGAARAEDAPSAAKVRASPTPAVTPVSARLPDLWGFVQELDAAVARGEIGTTEQLIARCRAFYTADQIDKVEAVIPGWRHMASFDNSKTLWHVNVAILALMRLEEYQAAPPERQALLQWLVLLHDIAKEPVGGRDHRHSFRSAAHVGRLLPGLGFPVSEDYRAEFAAWFALTDTAVKLAGPEQLPIQDNARLPGILAGIARLFPEPSRTLVTAIALHQSITSLAAWPVASPMTREDTAAALYPELMEPLLALTLADSGGWNLFEPATLAAMTTETRGVFAGLPGARR